MNMLCCSIRRHPTCLYNVFLLQFFSPLVVSKILIECGPDGRPSGEADVYFSCHQDAMAAMSRDRQHIGETAGEPLAPAPAD